MMTSIKLVGIVMFRYLVFKVKNLPTADSGMICFKDEEDDKLARQLSWLGIDKSTYDRYNKGTYNWKYDVPNVGYKYHGNALMGVL